MALKANSGHGYKAQISERPINEGDLDQQELSPPPLIHSSKKQDQGGDDGMILNLAAAQRNYNTSVMNTAAIAASPSAEKMIAQGQGQEKNRQMAERNPGNPQRFAPLQAGQAPPGKGHKKYATMEIREKSPSISQYNAVHNSYQQADSPKGNGRQNQEEDGREFRAYYDMKAEEIQQITEKNNSVSIMSSSAYPSQQVGSRETSSQRTSQHMAERSGAVGYPSSSVIEKSSATETNENEGSQIRASVPADGNE